MSGLVGGRGGEAVSPGPLLLVWTPTVPGPHHCARIKTPAMNVLGGVNGALLCPTSCRENQPAPLRP